MRTTLRLAWSALDRHFFRIVGFVLFALMVERALGWGFGP